LTTALSVFAIMGMTGLAVDLGRMYVAKNETQSFVDSAAISAALELNGTLAGFDSARQEVDSSANRWNFGTRSFVDPVVEFSVDSAGPWESNPGSAVGYRFARVTSGVDVPLSFIQVIAEGETREVNAQAVAGQLLKTSFREGLFPFSPFAHPDTIAELDADPVSGLVPGNIYTLRWSPTAKVSNPNTMCSGDTYEEMIDIAKAGGGEERGYIEDTSADILREAIVFDRQTVFREVGDSVWMSGGAKQTQKDALVERVRQDTEAGRSAQTFNEYFNHGNPVGNGRRLVAAPINVGEPGGYEIVQIGAFYLLNEEVYLANAGGNKPFCAEYVGAYVQGSSSPGAGGSGYYVVRLVQ
jgi:hypothetical protein